MTDGVQAQNLPTFASAAASADIIGIKRIDGVETVVRYTGFDLRTTGQLSAVSILVAQNASVIASINSRLSATSAANADRVSNVSVRLASVNTLATNTSELVSALTSQVSTYNDLTNARVSGVSVALTTIAAALSSRIDTVSSLVGSGTGSVTSAQNASVNNRVSLISSALSSIEAVLSSRIDLASGGGGSGTLVSAEVFGDVTILSGASINVSTAYSNWTILLNHNAGIRAVVQQGNWGINRTVTLVQNASGAPVSITTAASVTIRSRGQQFTTSGKHAVAGLLFINSSTAYLSGDLV